MNSTIHVPLDFTSEEFAILAELLESERAKLLIEIRHTHHRSFRDELRHRLTLVESLVERCPGTMSAGSQKTGLGAEEFTGGKVCQSQLRKSSCGEARSTTSRERLLLYRLP